MSNETAAKVPGPFVEEFRTSWHQLPNKAFFFALLAAWLALFQWFGNSTMGYSHSPSLLYWLYRAYKGESYAAFEGDDSHGILIPLAILVLMWYKRKELLSQSLRVWPPALVIVAASLLLHVFGFLIQQPRVSVLGLFLGTYGLMGLAWGPGWLRASFFPVLMFAFAVPLGSAVDIITFPLRLMVTKIVAFIAQHILSINVACEGTRLFKLPDQYEYEVAAACSGIRSLVAIIAIAVVYAFMAFKDWWKRITLLASAIPLAVIGNTFRLLAIVVAAEIGGQAEGAAVHESPTWSMLPYIPAMLGLFLIGRWLERKNAHPKPEETPAPKTSATP